MMSDSVSQAISTADNALTLDDQRPIEKPLKRQNNYATVQKQVKPRVC